MSCAYESSDSCIHAEGGAVHKADACTLAQENLPDEHYQWDGNRTFQFNETVDYRLPLSRLGIIQTSLASALAAPSVVSDNFREEVAHVLASLFYIEMFQATVA